jgi:predicted CoA-substrate-specific enzyme activase
MRTCGVDIGARSIDIVVFEDERIIASSVSETGISPRENALGAFRGLLAERGLGPGDILRTVATGYGRNAFEEADRVASEILCHAAGISFLFPSARTVIDIGAQDSKVIRLDETGTVIDFIMNDRCAAGTGKFIEMAASMLQVSLEETGRMALQTAESVEISSMCAVFAESEIIGLLHKGVPREVILRGIYRSIARRTLGMAGRFGLEKDVVFTGGVALNRGVVEVLKREARMADIRIPPAPQVTGALGAAILAARDAAGRRSSPESVVE